MLVSSTSTRLRNSSLDCWHKLRAGEEVVIARRGEPVVMLVACKARGRRQPDALKGKVTNPDSFFEPLRDEELKAWEGR